jgi:ribonuclease HI
MNYRIVVYTDGACSGNPGPGGYAAILVAYDASGKVVKERTIVGGEKNTTNNQMEIRAVIEGLKTLTQPSEVRVVSDSQYVINTMTKGWKRRKNQELWDELDALCAKHKVTWEYIKGHAGHHYNERCDKLAVAEIEKIRRAS